MAKASPYAIARANPFAARIKILKGLNAEDKHAMLCYILGFNPAVFDYAVCAMLSEHGETIEIDP